ncbi:MAG TPA: ATP-dependent 6-phosphofructokinase [Pseudomonadota bacterium]|jgi:6-phosphofructokinase|nr:ATP-dependent 6-phosphofructokinase [Deltaproteobacteria bacterium]HPH28791.1 ATP-dependent 6-phosphofructokinase [Pseudomonadota bacterium]
MSNSQSLDSATDAGSQGTPIRRIGILTGGGDAPGLNPAIKAVVNAASARGWEVMGLYDGWQGLLGEAEPWLLDEVTVQKWDRDGGTQLGSSRTNPFSRRGPEGQKIDLSHQVLENLSRLGIDALVPIGGEDTLGVAARLIEKGVRIVGIPKTIDKDLQGTDYSLGFDTAVSTCADLIERAHSPAGSHHFIQVVEVMGRHAGHLALWSGLAGGAFMTLIPEHDFVVDKMIDLINAHLERGKRDRRFPRYGVIVVAEGAKPTGGHELTLDTRVDEFGHARLGGIGHYLSTTIKNRTKWDARSVLLGHPQRGGSPSPIDRNMGYLFGCAAVEAIAAGRFGTMVSARGIAPALQLGLVPITEVRKGLNLVDVAHLYDTQHYRMKQGALLNSLGD